MKVQSHPGIREQILEALRHPEAEEGLYFRNFFHLHEEDERRPVSGEQSDIMAELNKLIADGLVKVSPGAGEDAEVIFSLSPGSKRQ
jgi:hypothetical protein